MSGGQEDLAQKSSGRKKLDVDPHAFEGGVSVLFGYADEVAPARIAMETSKKYDVVKIFGGMLENEFVDMSAVINLAKLPSKQQLLAQVVGTINAPVSGFVNVLAGNIRGLVNVLNAVKDTKQN